MTTRVGSTKWMLHHFITNNGLLDPGKIARRGQEQIDQIRKEAQRALRLRDKLQGTPRGQAFDRLTRTLKQLGGSRSAMLAFLRSDEGKAAIKLLNAGDVKTVRGQLMARGVSAKQIDKLQDDISNLLQQTIATRIMDKIEPTQRLISGLLRDSGKRAAFVKNLAALPEKKRLELLAGLGIEGDTAKRIAGAPAECEAALTGALRNSEANFDALRRECLGAMRDPRRALTLLAVANRAGREIRDALHLPNNGSFAGMAVQRGIKQAESARDVERLVCKALGAVASMFANGMLASALTSMITSAGKYGEASSRRQAAEAAEASGLADPGTAQQERAAERKARKEMIVNGVASAAKSGAGEGLKRAVGEVPAKVAAELDSVVSAGRGAQREVESY